MTRPDDEFPPLDVTSTLNLGSLDEAERASLAGLLRRVVAPFDA